MKKRVIVDVTRSSNTGIGKYSWNLLEYLNSHNHEFTFIGLTLPQYEAYGRERGINCTVISDPPRTIDVIRELSDLVNRSGDIYLSTNLSQPIFPSIPIIQVVHDLIFLTHPEWQPTQRDLELRHGTLFNLVLDIGLPWLRSVLLGKIENSSLQTKEPTVSELYNLIQSYFIIRSSAIITVSQTTKNEFTHHFKLKTPVKVIYPIFYDSLDEIEIHPRRENKNHDTLNLLYIANFEPRKNHRLMFEAVEDLQIRTGVSVTVTLLGKGMFESQEIEFFKLLNKYNDKINIRILSDITEEDKQHLLSASDIMVFPSLAEGVGLPLIEAMSSGLPIIALDIPSTREVCGEAVFYIPENSSVQLADAIFSIYHSPDMLNARIAASKNELGKFAPLDVNAVFNSLAFYALQSGVNPLGEPEL